MKVGVFHLFFLFLVLTINHRPAYAQATDSIEQIRDYIGLSRNMLGVNNQKAYELSSRALEMARRMGIDSLKAKAHRFGGIATYYLSDFNQSLQHYDSALYYFRLLNDSIGQARIHNNIGAVYTQLNLFQKAIAEYLRARDVYESLNNSRGITILYNNIGSLYQYLRDFKTATFYYNQAVSLAAEKGFTDEQINALNNIATIHELEHRMEEAEKAYRNALQMADKLENPSVKANLLLNFGSFWISRGQSDSALINFYQAREIYRDMNLNLAKLYLGMARAYKMKSQTEQATGYYKLALENVGKGSDAVLRLNILKELAGMLARKADYPGAYRLLTEYAEETDLIRNENDSLKNTIIQLHFNINRLEMQADSLSLAVSEAKSKYRNAKTGGQVYLTLLLLSLLVLVVITVFFSRYRKAWQDQHALIENQNREKSRLLDENKALNEKAAELTNLNNLLKALVSATPNPLGIKDGDNRWLIANASMCQLMGVADGDLDDCSSDELLRKTTHSPDFLRMLEVAEELVWMKAKPVKTTEKLSEAEEFRVIRVPVFESNGERKYLIIYIISGEEGRMSDNRLSTDSVTRALSTLSHEIRTPLNAVLGFSELLSAADLEPAKRRQYSRIIQRNGNVLLKLVDDMLTYFSLETGSPDILNEPFDLRELFVGLHTRLINKAAELGKHNLEIKISIPDKPAIIIGDEVRWQQILDNLTDNAVSYTSHGFVSVGFNIEDDDDQRMVKVFVEDSGDGINPEMQKEVFKPFVRLADKHIQKGGAGLGLSIVKLLAEKMNITLKLQSTPGMGTRFDLEYISGKTDEVKREPAESISQLSPKLAGKKVLIVEDVESNTELLRIILEGAGAEVYHAETGEEAVETCAREKKLDLVLMDIQLPKMNGLDATRKIKQFRPGLPVIAYTAYAMANEKDACFEAGCDGYVAKPVKPRLLLPILEQLLAKNVG